MDSTFYINFVGYLLPYFSLLLCYRAMKLRPEIKFLRGYFTYSLIACIGIGFIVFDRKLIALFSSNFFDYRSAYLVTLLYHFYFLSRFLLTLLNCEKKQYLSFFARFTLTILSVLVIKDIGNAKISSAYLVSDFGLLFLCFLVFMDKKSILKESKFFTNGLFWLLFGISTSCLTSIPYIIFYDKYSSILTDYFIIFVLLGNVPSLMLFGGFSKAFWQFAKNDSNRNSG